MKIVLNLYSLEINEERINASFGLQLRPQRLPRLLQLRPQPQPHFVVAAYPLYCAFAKVELRPPFHLIGKHHFVVVAVVVAEAAGTEAVEAVGEADRDFRNLQNVNFHLANWGCHRVFSVPVR